MSKTTSFRYIAFNKPYNVLSQFTPDEPGQRTLADYNLPPGVYPVGRLDKDSEGLLLLSDDGAFIKKLLDPANRHPRTYLTQVENVPDATALTTLRSGLVLKIDKKPFHTQPCQAVLLDTDPALPPRDPPIRQRANIPTAWIELTLVEGKNRQVRRMTAAVGHPTLRLVRSAIGTLGLGSLAPGEWRDVRYEDVMPANAAIIRMKRF